MQTVSRCPALLIGYGNELRGDDALGPRFTRTVADWQNPGLRCLVVPQLMPELAAEIAQANRVIFADASLDAAAEPVSLHPVEPSHTPTGIGHVGHPATLLALTQIVYGRVPPAWWLRIHAADLDFGRTLSTPAQNALDLALRKMREFLEPIPA
jgi:hydrogenase maturation protease